MRGREKPRHTQSLKRRQRQSNQERDAHREKQR